MNAFHILDSAAFEIENFCEDNGGLCDGEWINVCIAVEHEAEAVAKGLAEYIDVEMASDEAILGVLGIHPDDDFSWDDAVIEQCQASLTAQGRAWSHYGAYGASDSLWLIARGK